MRGALAIAAREIAERKLVFFGAFLAGLLPLGLPLLPAFPGDAHHARSVAMLLLATAITAAFPLFFGATMLASDISEKRLAFYFSRPLPATSIWAGKLLGAFLISFGCAALASAPVLLLDGEAAFSLATGLSWERSLALAVSGVLLLLLLAHVAASIVRLRSAWIIPDSALAVVFAVAIALSIRRLFLAGFRSLYEPWRSPARSLWFLPVALVAILLAASCVQIIDGRTDARRSHGALSATLWGLTAVFAAILGGLAWWVAGGG